MRRSLANSETIRAPEARVNAESLHLEMCFERGLNLRERVLQLTDEIGPETFAFLDSALTELERASRKTVTIRMYSLGGSVYAALALVGRIRKSPCHIVVEGYGAIMSAATLVLACADKRRLSSLAFFMHHESAYAVEGRHSSNKAAVAQAEQEERKWAEAMADFTGTASTFWLSQGVHVDAYFGAQELLDLGVVDEIF